MICPCIGCTHKSKRECAECADGEEYIKSCRKMQQIIDDDWRQRRDRRGGGNALAEYN